MRVSGFWFLVSGWLLFGLQEARNESESQISKAMSSIKWVINQKRETRNNLKQAHGASVSHSSFIGWRINSRPVSRSGL